MQLFASDFNANDFAMMPDSELPETEFAQRVFAFFHHGEGFARNWPAVFDTGRQTGGGGLIPDTQAGIPRERANVVLA